MVSSNNVGFKVSEVGLKTETQRRSGGPFENGGENRYAQVLIVLVPLALFLVIVERRLLMRLTAAACLAVIGAGIVYTFSRGAAIAFVGMTILAVLLRVIRFRHLVLLVLGVALLLIAVPSYWVRLSSLETLPGTADPTSGQPAPDTSIQGRSTENLAALLIFADHPIVGVGPGLYPQYYQLYADRLGDYSNQLDIRLKYSSRQAHNLYLGLISETGILGLVTFLGAVLVTFRDLLRARKRCLRDKPELALLASCVVLALAAYLIDGIFLHLAYQRYFFFILALGACASAIALRAAVAEDERPDEEPEHLRYWARRRRTTSPSSSSPGPDGQPAGLTMACHGTSLKFWFSSPFFPSCATNTPCGNAGAEIGGRDVDPVRLFDAADPVPFDDLEGAEVVVRAFVAGTRRTSSSPGSRR